MIPSEVRLITYAAALVGALGGFGLFVHHEKTVGAQQCIADGNAKALAASIATQAVSAQRVAAVQETAHVAETQASAARADAALARTADERLRARLSALSRAASAHTAAACPGVPPTGAETVPADLFGRFDETAGQLGEYADQLRTAADACVRSYGALK